MTNIKIGITENGTTTLATAGKYCDKNIDVEVNIPTGDNKIPDIIFNGSSKYQLTKADLSPLPTGATKIRRLVFDEDTRLESIKIPEGITTIGDNAFIGCKNLKEVEFPSTLTTLETSNFEKCSSLTSIDLKNVSSIGTNAFKQCSNLSSIISWDNVATVGYSAFDSTNLSGELVLPATLTEIKSGAFNYTKINTLKILNNTNVITIDVDSFPKNTVLTTVFVPANLYTAYKAHQYWGTYNILPDGEFPMLDDNFTVAHMEINQVKEFTIPMVGYNTTPQVSITTSNELIIASNPVVSDDLSAITFTLTAQSTAGECEVSITIQNEQIYTKVNTITVWEEMPEPSYEVIDYPVLPNSYYPFVLNDSGYYESTNQNKNSSSSVCQVNIFNPLGLPVYFDCINSGEANYDYGMLYPVNAQSATGTPLHNFKGKSSPTNILTVKYTDAVGDCSIIVRFSKDSSGNQGNDSLQFKVRFGE